MMEDRKELISRENERVARPVDVKELFYLFLGHWRWFALSLVLCLSGAVLWLARQNRVYTVSTMILMKGENSNTTSSEKLIMDGLGITPSGKTNIDDEIGIMCSRNVMMQVVMDLQLYTEYRARNGLRREVLYRDTPLRLAVDSLLVRHVAPQIDIVAHPLSQGYELRVRYNETETTIRFIDDSLRVEIGDISFMVYRNNAVAPDKRTLYISVQNPKVVAQRLASSVRAVPVDKNSAIINMSLDMSNVAKARDILTKVVYYYNALSVNEKNRVAENTERFIDERLRLLSSELGSVEKEVENFMRTNELVDITAAAASYLDESNGVEERLFDIESQINRLNYIEEFVSDSRNTYSLIPAVDITSQTFLNIVDTYNKKLLEREQLLRSVSESNPVLITINQDIAILRKGVKDGIVSTRANMNIVRADLLNKKKEAKTRIQEVPGLQRESAEINRQQAIKDKLYVFLLEKREENSLNKTLTVPMAIIMDEPDTTGRVVFPRPVRTMAVALCLALALPAVVIGGRYYFNDKFRDRSDVERLTPYPIMGEICINKDTDSPLVVTAHSTLPIVELFRLLRNNLQFVMTSGDKRVICVTSMISGEGKTFIASNLALSLALVGKRVLLVGLDIRRPRLHHYFSTITHRQGVTTYLSAISDDISALIQPSGVDERLDILPSGPIPPNPNELLGSPRFAAMMHELRDMYDYIVLDTAPMGQVSDTQLVAREIDTLLFVVRAHYTSRKTFGMFSEILSGGGTPSPYLVINGVDMSTRAYSYRRYGYGYHRSATYGYGANGTTSASERKTHHKL